MSLLRSASRIPLRVVTRRVGPSVVRFNSSSSATEKPDVDPKIKSIVDQISTLTLLETSTLVNELKERLNIPDISMPVAGAAPAAAPAGGEAEAEEVKEEPEEKTIFGVKLETFDAGSKPKIIKEIKSLLGYSLVDSKKFVEATPKMLKENVAKEDAEKIKATLEGLGAKVVLE